MVFDFKTSRWLDPAQFAKRPFPGNHHCAEVHDQHLFLLGGLTYGNGKGQVYDFDKNQWSEFDMPFEAGSASSALIGDYIYYCGGIWEKIKDTVNTCQKLHIHTMHWSSDLSNMKYGVNHAAHCSDGTKFYVIGGRKGGNSPGESFDYNQVYDPQKNSWVQKAPLPVPRGGMGKCIVAGKATHQGGTGKKLYVFGGESRDHHLDGITDVGTYTFVDVYDIEKDQWSRGPEMDIPRHGIWPIAYEDVVMVAGGGVKVGYS